MPKPKETEFSARLVSAVYRLNLSSHAKSVLICLLSHRMPVTIKEQTIAKNLSVSWSTVRRSIDEIIQAKIITKERRWKMYEYRLICSSLLSICTDDTDGHHLSQGQVIPPSHLSHRQVITSHRDKRSLVTETSDNRTAFLRTPSIRTKKRSDLQSHENREENPTEWVEPPKAVKEFLEKNPYGKTFTRPMRLKRRLDD